MRLGNLFVVLRNIDLENIVIPVDRAGVGPAYFENVDRRNDSSTRGATSRHTETSSTTKLSDRFWSNATMVAPNDSPKNVLIFRGGESEMHEFEHSPAFDRMAQQYYKYVDNLKEFVGNNIHGVDRAHLLGELSALVPQMEMPKVLSDFHQVKPHFLYSHCQIWLDKISDMVKSDDVPEFKKEDILRSLCTGLSNCGEGVTTRLERAARDSELALKGGIKSAVSAAKNGFIDDKIQEFVVLNESWRGYGELPHVVPKYQQVLSGPLGIRPPVGDARVMDVQLDANSVRKCEAEIKKSMTVENLVDHITNSLMLEFEGVVKNNIKGDKADIDLDVFCNAYNTAIKPLLDKYSLDLTNEDIGVQISSETHDSVALYSKQDQKMIFAVAVQDALRREGLVDGGKSLIYSDAKAKWVKDGALIYAVQPHEIGNKTTNVAIKSSDLERISPNQVGNREVAKALALQVMQSTQASELLQFPVQWLVDEECLSKILSRLDVNQSSRFIQENSKMIEKAIRQPGGQEVARALALNGLPPSYFDKIGIHPKQLIDHQFMFKLIERGNREWVDRLGAEGVKFNFSNPEWPYHPVAAAVLRGDVEMAEHLVKHCNATNPFRKGVFGHLSVRDEDLGSRILMDAARQGKVDVLRAVLHMSRGKLKEGYSELLASNAVHYRHVDILKELDQWGFKLSGSGHMAWAVAASVELSDLDALAFLASRGYLDKATLDAEFSLRGNGRSEQCSLLTYAAKYGNQEMVQLLLERGADWTRKDRRGVTPLEYAQRLGRDPIVAAITNFAQFKNSMAR